MRFPLILAAIALTHAGGCGYRVAGRSDLLPPKIKTIAIPAFDNLTTRYKLSDRIPEMLAREFISRTRYQVVPQESSADAVLKGAVVNYISYPTVYDQATGRAVGVQFSVFLQLTLYDRETGAVLFTRPSLEVRQRYEISPDTAAYFEESDTALDRLSREVARSVVSTVLESF